MKKKNENKTYPREKKVKIKKVKVINFPIDRRCSR